MARKKSTTVGNVRRVKKKAEKPLTANQVAALNATLSRAALRQALGETYDGKRDVYRVLGYPKEITYKQYNDAYERQDIAQRIVDAKPDATWRGQPAVFDGDTEEDETEFTTAWADFAREKNIYHFFTRVDRVAGIGRYGVLYLGFNDGAANLRQPVGNATDLLYMQPFSEDNATIKSSVSKRDDPRFGLPEFYDLRVANVQNYGVTKANPDETLQVHWSRVIHVPDLLKESSVFGKPRLKGVYNRLLNLEIIVGGSAEMYWRGAYPGISFEMDADTELDPQDAEDLDEEIDKYVHDLSRYIRLKGTKAKSLAPQIANPEKHVMVQVQMISANTRIPVRILMGSERGELASTQDQENWESVIEERQLDFAEPVILREFIKRMQAAGVLPQTREGSSIKVNWPDMGALSAKDKAEVAKVRSEAIRNYVVSGSAELIPPFQFLTKILGMSVKEAEDIMDDVIKMIRDEDDELEGALGEQAQEDGDADEGATA